MSKVPQRRFYGDSSQTMLQTLISWVPSANQEMDRQGWTGRRVLGYKVPDWQRQIVWTDEQCVRLIESIYLGANIGQIMINITLDNDTDRILLDGQQRLRAIERYITDEFPVTGEDGKSYFWSELEIPDRRRFERIPIPTMNTQYRDMAVLREAYNRHNFSGTPHKPEEIADPGDFYVAPPGFNPG